LDVGGLDDGAIDEYVLGCLPVFDIEGFLIRKSVEVAIVDLETNCQPDIRAHQVSELK
jgi:hypothetical protein